MNTLFKGKLVAKRLVAGSVVFLVISALLPLSANAAKPAVDNFYVTGGSWVNDVNQTRWNASFSDEDGLKRATFKVWSTQGNCQVAGGAGCLPGQKVAEWTKSLGGETSASIMNESVHGIIRPFVNGSYVTQVEVEDNISEKEVSELKWFWIDKYNPGTPSITSPSQNKSFDTSRVRFNWTNVSDTVPASGLRSGIQGYVFELYKGSSRLHQTGIRSASDITMTSLANGNYRARVRAVDNAGNYGDWSAFRNITVDKNGNEPADEPTEDPSEEPDTPQGTVSDAATDAADAIAEAIPTLSDIDSPTKEVKDSKNKKKKGEVLGTADENIDEDTGLEAEAGSFWKKLKGLFKKWWFWLIVAAIVAFLIWLLSRRREEKDNIEANQYDI